MSRKRVWFASCRGKKENMNFFPCSVIRDGEDITRKVFQLDMYSDGSRYVHCYVLGEDGFPQLTEDGKDVKTEVLRCMDLVVRPK